MAKCSFAEWVGPSGTPHGHMEPTTLVWHSDTVSDHRPVPVTPTEFHFWIDYEGDLYQFNDTNVKCDANFEANDFAISCETSSNRNATDLWTAKQFPTMKRLALWCRDTHGISLARCKSFTGGGQGYHCMWGIPGPWNHSGHTCPGPTRVKQFDEVFLPSLLTPAKPTDQEIEMPDALLMRVDGENEVWCVSTAGRWHVTKKALATLRFFAMVRPGPGSQGEFIVQPEDREGFEDFPIIAAPALPNIPTGGLTGTIALTGTLTPKV